jgi:hypothetical protein
MTDPRTLDISKTTHVNRPCNLKRKMKHRHHIIHTSLFITSNTTSFIYKKLKDKVLSHATIKRKRKNKGSRVCWWIGLRIHLSIFVIHTPFVDEIDMPDTFIIICLFWRSQVLGVRSFRLGLIKVDHNLRYL